MKLLIKNLLLVFLIPLSSSWAQEMSALRVYGNSQILSDQLIDKSIIDANGEICAGLIISSDLSGLTYTANNGIVKITSRPGEDLLFLSPEERAITVYKTGYSSLKILLNEYGIRLKSGQVWKIGITGDKRADLIPINIVLNVDNVKLSIDGVAKGTNQTQTISEGKHTIKLEKEGYRTIETEINVSNSSTLFNFKMKEIDLLPVQFTSSPTGAKIVINDMEKGETDKGVFLMPGEYKVRLSKSGYLAYEVTIKVSENSNNIFNYTLTKNAGTLNLSVEPADSKVLINKEDYSGKTGISLTPGIYKIEIEKQGYNPVRETVEIKLGESVKKTFRLEAKTGGLQFNIKPLSASADLKMNGKTAYSWKGMKILKDLPVGEYSLECKADGYRSVIKNITIEEGKTRQEEITLDESKWIQIDEIRKEAYEPGNESVFYEGKIYHTLKIGNQVWLKENLDVGSMIDGRQEQRNNGVIEKYCYDNDYANCKTYGGLYQWTEAVQYKKEWEVWDVQGICPKGWHIPTETELKTLIETIGNNSNDLKNKEYSQGTDTYGFSVLFAGSRGRNGVFYNSENYTGFWSSTESNNTYALSMNLNFVDNTVLLNNSNKSYGFSIRCLKD